MAYLDAQQYVDRFGARETTLFTNYETPQGQGATYDTAKVEDALEDATDEVDSYVGRRYAVPLSSTPRLVVGWTAAIARFKLATVSTRVNENIKDAADRAYGQLRDLVAGKMNLPIEEGDAQPGEVSAGDPLTSRDREAPTFGCGRLDAFTAPFTGGNCAPNWMR